MSPTARILLAFLQTGGQFISGAALGRRLGVSRVSVHHHLEALKAGGFVFSAIRNRGYRLEHEPDAVHPALLEALLAEQPIPFFAGGLCLGATDSTNSVAEAELAKGRPAPFYVIADTQSAGRGRRGRSWHSPPRSNLYLSVGLRPNLPPARLQSITVWLGLRLCRFLRDTFALPVQVKWPNDLFLHGRKVAGMLTEARVDAEATRDLVFGLGLNVNCTEADFPPELAGIAGSIGPHLGRPVNLSRLAHGILGALAAAIPVFLDGHHAEELVALWPQFDYLRGRTVSNGMLEGRVLGINPSGALRLERPDGSIALLHSGEVSLGSGTP